MKKIIGFIMAFVVMFSSSIYVKAEETPYIYDSTMKAIEKAVEEYEVEQSYMDEVIALYSETTYTNSEDLNEMVMDALEKAIRMKIRINNELQDAEKKQTEMVSLNEETETETAGVIDAEAIARAAYLDGVALVRLAGCPQTATYMLNAMLPVPINIVHDNDEWAQSCTYNQAFTDKIFPQFELEILAQGKTSGSIEGDFTFITENSSLDHHMALHKVSYTATFAMASDGNGYSVVFNISDIYDFDWTNYDNIAVGFGNNYCVGMQLLGLIHPFTISIIGRG